ncbi:hypothetical protein A6A12_1248 [Vibrio anguillarum]|nr:hypothetical protein A6A12_1248 [Vibrio anguillarum]
MTILSKNIAILSIFKKQNKSFTLGYCGIIVSLLWCLYHYKNSLFPFRSLMK